MAALYCGDKRVGLSREIVTCYRSLICINTLIQYFNIILNLKTIILNCETLKNSRRDIARYDAYEDFKRVSA